MKNNNNPWGLTEAEARTVEGVLRLGHRKRLALETGLSVKCLDQQLRSARLRMEQPTTLAMLVAYDRWKNSLRKPEGPCPTCQTTSGDHTVCKACRRSWPTGKPPACHDAVETLLARAIYMKAHV